MGAAHNLISTLPEQTTYDVAVLGAGAAGLTAAVYAGMKGGRVLLIERTEYLGGTSALSAATTWVPNTHHSPKVGADDSFEKVSGFLDRAVGNRSPKSMRDTFLQQGPAIIADLENSTEVQFRPRPFHPDYLSEIEGSTTCGRALEPVPFVARDLGEDLKLIRPPIPEFTILGGLMVDRDDISQLLKLTKSFSAFRYSFKLIMSYFYERLFYGRGTRLVMGNALTGRMLKAARKLGVDIAVNARVTDIHMDNGRASAIVVSQGNATRTIAIKGGIVLASGGFSRHPQKRETYFPKPVPQYSPAAPGHTGELHDIVLGLGAHYGQDAYQPCFWAPVSLRKRADGSMAVFPHFVFDRSKPGTVCVGKDGRRFVNESTSYHLFGAAQFAENKNGSTIPAFIITDSVGLKKYGLGMVRPGGGSIKAFLADGYLTEGASLDDLARKLGIDAHGLKDTVAQMNEFARTGIDTQFGRGTTTYHRANGDPEHGPNPTLGPIGVAPFYAVKLYPGDIGAAMGLVANENAQVLREDGAPIAGLYVAGNDMQSIIGGVYPGPGITIGPGIVFGALAARHAMEQVKT